MRNQTWAFVERASAVLLVLLVLGTLAGCGRKTLAIGSRKGPPDGAAGDSVGKDLAEIAADDVAHEVSGDLSTAAPADAANPPSDLAQELPKPLSCLPGRVGFAAEAFYDSFGFTTFVAVGDFNGDGIPDLAVCNGVTLENAPAGTSPNTVSVLVNEGQGTFAEPVPYSTGQGSGPVSIATGDFNRDGFDDIAVANSDSGEVGVFVNTGNGALVSPIRYSTGIADSDPRSIAVGDFDGDGWPDLVLATHDADSAWLFSNRGDGNFAPPKAYDSVAHATRVVVSDFNGDRHPDFAVLGDEMAVFLNLGDGRFAEPDRYAVTGQDLAMADFDGDGHPDLGLSNVASIGIISNVGGGKFASPNTLESPSKFQHALVAGDFNGDGHPDIAVTSEIANPSLNLFLNDGHGAFAAPVVYSVSISSLTTYPWSLAAGDFNGDGYLDLALGYWTSLSSDGGDAPSRGQVGIFLSECLSPAPQ